MSSRRSFVRLIALGGAGTILAACASPAPTATPAPAAGTQSAAAKPPAAAPEPTKPAAPAAPAPAPTTAAAPAAAATKPAAAPAAAPAKPKEKITLRLWHWDTFLVEPYEKMGAEFTKKNPHATVVIEQTPAAEYPQKVIASIAGNAAPDLIGLTVTRADFLTFASKGQLTPLMPYIQRDKFDIDDFYDLNLKQLTWKGTLFGLPYTWDTMAWFFNEEIFQKAELKTPTQYWKEGKWNWTTYLELASKLTTGSGLEKQWGTGVVSPTSTAAFLPLLWSNGGELFDPEYTRPLLTEAADMGAFKFAFDTKKFAPGPEDSKTGTAESGRLAMWPNWDVYYVLYRDSTKFKYSFLPPPAAPTSGKHFFTGNAPGFGIAKGAKSPDESWELLKFVLTPEQLTNAFLVAYAGPPRKSLNRSADLYKKNNKFFDPAQVHEVAQAKEMARIPPKISTWAQMLTAMREEMTLVWADKQSLDDGVKKVADQWGKLLKEAEIDKDGG